MLAGLNFDKIEHNFQEKPTEKPMEKPMEKHMEKHMEKPMLLMLRLK